ncbi:Bifunctional ligase/repressor BirA [Anatilimnocola aggregata]|uniref:biotin--[biotin carboxyl-carrier protein] ligase n=1 Tax=Anatilimnocola aggregata TaxID=2528021 RepID=A0A517YEQ1_9BACT|nr:biotin--[acetyl-CoA-carboxylase] ligase [Anatilimnocola aggregata]QDU28720.1 Bifunctional ligase/repressor BirA [Anatilimnocola aggregata]
MKRDRFDLPQLARSGLIERLEFHQSLASTNDRAAALAAEEWLACPALVLAQEQTAGRGRGSNRWWSVPGSLMFSLIISGSPGELGPAQWPGFSLVAGLAVCEALASHCLAADIAVKWPNDVYANERKICGILIESPAPARGRMIVGIGVNVNNSFADAPEELRDSATALCDVDGQPHDLTDVLRSILGSLDQRWQQLREQGFSSLRQEWRDRSLLTGRIVQLQAGAQRHTGRCLGIDDDGALLLQTERGRQSFHAGSIVSFE